MLPKSIGILGGAGPIAGVCLLEKVLSLAGSVYGCTRDADFPKVFFINFPFSEMLLGEIDKEKLQDEIKGCLSLLRNNGACVLAIACNTLHAFLNEEEENAPDLIHLPREVLQEIPSSEVPLVLCTTTSARCNLHKKFFPCAYPDEETQGNVDRIINQILGGGDLKGISQEFLQIVEKQSARVVILGCTELSLLNKELALSTKLIIDPLEIAALKVLQKYFYQKELS